MRARNYSLCSTLEEHATNLGVLSAITACILRCLGTTD
jgi:hypothetical protein